MEKGVLGGNLAYSEIKSRKDRPKRVKFVEGSRIVE